MNPQTKKTLVGILIGVAISLVIYFVITPSPFALAIGCVAGVYFAQPDNLLQGAYAGMAVAAPLGVYLSALVFFASPSAPRSGLLPALQDLVLVLAFGALYGAVFVWLNKRYSRGQKTIT